MKALRADRSWPTLALVSLIDAVPHPQAVFLGFENDDPGLAAMQSMVEGSLVLDAQQPHLANRRERDFDIWVQLGSNNYTPPDHLHFLAFCAATGGLVSTARGGSALSYGGENRSPTMRVMEGLPEDLDRLVRHEVIPLLQSRETRPYLFLPSGSSGGWGSAARVAVSADSHDVNMVPFLFDADDHVIAGAFRRYGPDDAWVWMLPHVPLRPELWLAVALRDWHQKTPDRIPVANPWQSRSEWMTQAEVDAELDLQRLEERRRNWEARYAARREQLEAQKLRARTNAAHGMRRLLTAHGDELVDAVTDALRELGYEVTDEDPQRIEVGVGKAHDLNVIDPDRPGRAVIAEVKGYQKGARGALAQATQHVLRYTVAHAGQPPDECWLIINHLRERDPDERAPLLQGADEDIAIFSQSGGLLVDTRDLFKLVRRVEQGVVTKEEARRMLAEAAGRLVLVDP